MKVGLVVHSGREESVTAAVDAARRLTRLGVDVVMARQRDEDGGVPVPQVESEGFAHGLDITLSFGGDGTFLRAAHLCREAGVPVLGLNLGRLGFLADVERDQVHATLEAVARGDFLVEERSTLQVWAEDADGRQVLDDWALNEVAIEKTARQRVLLMDMHVSGRLFTKVPADALIIASSTGSTAYSFSAGGPILSPEVPAILVTPVAPHSLFGRTVVLAEHERVTVEVLADQEPAVVSCDGRSPVTVTAGGSVHVLGGGAPVRLARVAPHDFYELVRAKFGLR